MRVSVRLLEEKQACAEQVKLFAETFGHGEVEVTEALCIENADKFDFGWAARNLLPKSLWADYHAKRTALVADYNAKRTALWVDSHAKRTALWDDYNYNAKDDAFWADYNAKRTALWDDYNAKRAAFFGELAKTVEEN